MDKTNVGTSKQNQKLTPHPTPPLATAVDKLPLDKIKLPAGFKVEVWSSGHSGRAHHGDGRQGHHVHGHPHSSAASTRSPTRTASATAKVLLQGLTQPNGLAFDNGSLYVFAINKVLRYDNIEDKLDNPGAAGRAHRQLTICPTRSITTGNTSAFGPDGKMYVQVGSNCNICETNPGIHGQIRRYNVDGSGMEIVARGVPQHRSASTGIRVTKELWFTDNGRDWAGNDGPEDELNRIPKDMEGASFGFPYCHAKGIPDPDVKRPNPCAGVILPAALHRPARGGARHQVLHRHHVPQASTRTSPSSRGTARGTGRRSSAMTSSLRDRSRTAPATIEPFLTGLLDDAKNEFYGRPAYVLPDDGRLAAGLRRDRTARSTASRYAPPKPRRAGRKEVKHGSSNVAAAGPRAGGRSRFARRAAHAPSMPVVERIPLCAACHGEDGNSQIENIPSLAGQPAFFVLNSLFLMREGVRKVDAMASFVKDLTDEDARGAGEALRQRCRHSRAASRSIQRWSSAVPVAAQRGCGSCHLPTLEGQDQMPRLAKQRIDYLIPTLKVVSRRAAPRRRHCDERRIAGASDADLAALAHFAASK